MKDQEEGNPPLPNISNLPEEKPPFFKKWKGMYWLVFGTLVFYIVFLYLFTKAFE